MSEQTLHSCIGTERSGIKRLHILLLLPWAIYGRAVQLIWLHGPDPDHGVSCGLDDLPLSQVGRLHHVSMAAVAHLYPACFVLCFFWMQQSPKTLNLAVGKIEMGCSEEKGTVSSRHLHENVSFCPMCISNTKIQSIISDRVALGMYR